MLPTATADLPGLDGRPRLDAEHLRCEEVLRRSPAGEGAHFILQVRHQGLGLKQVVEAIARAAVIDPGLVSHGAAYDRRPQTTRYLSVPVAAVDNPGALGGAGYKRKLKVLKVVQGAKPITAEGIVGLDWSCRLPGVGAQFETATALADRLRQAGLVNYQPAGLIGKGGQQAKWGRQLLLGKALPAAVARSQQSPGRMLAAAQALLFNRYAAARVSDGLLGSVIDGDVVEIGCNRPPAERSLAIVDEVESFQARADSWEVIVTGPLFGAEMPPATGSAGEREAAILQAAGLSPTQVARLRSGRRRLRVQPAKLSCDLHRGDLLWQCHLPCDTAISVLLEELYKPENHIL